MATEVERGEYLYTKGQPAAGTVLSEEDMENVQNSWWEESDDSGDDSEDEAEEDGLPRLEEPTADEDSASDEEADDHDPAAEIAFKVTPLHDLESIFWVSLWMLLCSEFVWDPTSNISEEQWKGHLIQHGEFAAELFCNSDFRRSVMSLGSTSKLLASLGKLLPRARPVLKALDRFRVVLLTQYIKFEENLTPKSKINFEEASNKRNLHNDLRDILHGIAEDLKAKENKLTIEVKAEPLPVRILRKALSAKQPDATATTAATATSTRTRPSADTDAEPSSRPAKAQRTVANQFAGMASAPTTVMQTKPTRQSARLQAKGTSGAGTSRSGRR